LYTKHLLSLDKTRTMKIISFFTFLLLFTLACNTEEDNPVDPVMESEFEGYSLVWNDEFNGLGISNFNWVYELGDGTDYGLNPGWGNEELQLYTDDSENAAIEKDGDEISALVITATEESPGNYRSAKLTTQGLRSFRYGKIDARIKLPTTQGMWPAFWMLGENIADIDWPGCGEIDIMELVGSAPDVVQCNVHYTDGSNNYSTNEGTEKLNETFDLDYHNFTIDWSPTELVYSLDGTPYKTTSLTDDMKEFQRSFYLILNVAVGGQWPGDPDATTNFPQKMYVDYVRYYSKDGFTAPDEPVLDITEETIGVFIPPSISKHVFNSTLDQFPDTELNVFGNGGEPTISTSDIVAEGDSSLLFSYPGGSWGGGWFEMNTPLDVSSYSSGNLVFSIQQSGVLNDAEVKLEAVSNSAAVYLINYTPSASANGYVEYTIPLSDFIDLDFTEIKIPFALWNPVDVNGAFEPVDVLIDNIYWVE